MTKEQLIDRHAQTLKSWIGTGLAKDECIGLIKNAVDEALFLNGVIVSEMRTSKEIIRLIELVGKIETEQSNKCVDMKLRDIVNTSFYRLKKVFNE